jgi:diguanylate cyclase (GGDEF)-like protein
MKKLLIFIFILFSSLHCISSYAEEESNHKALEKGFSPISELNQTVLGRQLFQLYQVAEQTPDEVYSKLIALSTKTPLFDSPVYQFAYYRTLHKLELARSQPLASEEAMKTLLAYAQKKQVVWLEAEANMWLSTFHAKRGEYKLGLALLAQVIPVAKQTNFLRLRARAHNTRAIIYIFQNKTYLAQQEFLKAFDIFKHYPNDPYLSKVTANISNIFQSLDMWDKALTYINKAIEYYEQGNQKSTKQLALLHLNASNVYANITSENALSIQRSNLDLANEYAFASGSIRTITHVQSNLSLYWFKQGDLDLSFKYANQCLTNAQLSKDIASSGYCNLYLAKTYLQKNQYKTAEKLLLKSLEEFTSIDLEAGLKFVYKQLALLHELNKNYIKALEYSKLFHQAKLDSLFSKRQDKINNLEQKYTSKEKQQEIALLSAKNALQNSQLSQQSLREAIALLLILLCSIAIYFLVRRYWILKKHNGSLETSNHILYEQSHHDALTGLFNRRYFEEQMNQPRLEDNSKYMLAIIDIDFFKKINDTYGHDVGDEVLCKLAKTLNDNIRQHDFVTRWGGEEFVITLAQTEQADIKTVLDRLKHTVQDTHIQTSSGNLSITLSIGVSNEITAHTLKNAWSDALESADKALYQAKNTGRNRIIYSNEVKAL